MATSTVSDLARAMAGTPLFQDASPSTIARLADEGQIRRFRRGTYLFHQGDDAPDVFFLVSGRVEISSLSSNGHRQLHTTLDVPQFFGELGVLGDQPRSAAALALEDSEVWRTGGPVLLDFLIEEPTAAQALLRALARQVLSQEAFVEDLLYLDLKGRVAKRLLQLVSPSLDELPADGAVVPSIVTHADLASLCGGSRENVTRILSDFQRRGFVERDGKRFVLKKISGLAKLAGL
ncbi:MAG TPA: Crp/Fnr family transcriptional regulator [Actinomycetota bacterium]|nr:Crp/Fnr family transcriptional regulator [Actinomycetota bacterium]